MMDVIILLGTIGALALGIDDNDRAGTTTAETHVLILLASSGMMLLAAARDLMIVFLGIELMSVSVYALAGLNRRSQRAAEGALKYFLLGAFSTAFLLYGIALVYGATGATGLAEIAERIDANGLATSPILLIGIAMLLVGFGFKVATVPFHMWAPDVYDGSPNPITAYMAATVKTAAFAAFLRVWLEAFPSEFGSWHRAVAGLAIATMIIGNAIGLQQRNLKRLLAYSSIAHAGFILVAIAAGTMQGASAMLFYLLAYTLATFGAFAVIIVLSPRRCTGHDRRSERALDGTPVARRGDDGVHARADGLSGVRRRRLPREVVRAEGRARRARAAVRARGRARPHDRHLRRLLPVRGDGDVHAAARRVGQRPDGDAGLDAVRHGLLRHGDSHPWRDARVFRALRQRRPAAPGRPTAQRRSTRTCCDRAS